MDFKHFSKNGTLLPIEQANISLSNIEYSYGYGVYESIKVRNKIAYFTKQHLERLIKSASILGIEHKFSEKHIEASISNLIKNENPDSFNVKIILLGAESADKAILFIIPLSPLFPDRKFYKSGVKTITHQYERVYKNAKSLNMLGSYLAYKKARSTNCYDALLIDANNIIAEGTRTNFFAIKDNEIFTQPDEKILPGVTRDTVMHVAKNMDYKVSIGEIYLEKIKDYDGAFLTSTSSKIMPIIQIDNYLFSEIPESVKLLMKKYDEFLDESKGFFNP